MKMSKKTMLLTSSALVATGILFTAVSTAFASETITQAVVSKQTAITMQEANDIVTDANKGCTINEIKFKNENGVNTYEIDITNSDNTKSEVKVNADNGSIIETKAKADKQTKNAQKAAIKTQQDTLNKNWTSMTDAQKEQVYALKDAEFDAQISKVESHVREGYRLKKKLINSIRNAKTKNFNARKQQCATI